MPLVALLLLTSSFAAAQAPGPAARGLAPLSSRRLFEISPAFGFGNAACGSQRPDGDCPADGAFAMSISGGWRFHHHVAVGLELAVWSFTVRDAWRGQLVEPATDAKLGSGYFGPYGRWYWFRDGRVDPYLQVGVGIGSIQAEAKSPNGGYSLKAGGATSHLGIGAEWQLTPLFRLGPQALAYVQVSSEICETFHGIDGGSNACRPPTTDAHGDREGVALSWRLLVVGTFTLGRRWSR